MENDCYVIRRCKSALLVRQALQEDYYIVSIRVRVRAKNPKGIGLSLCKNPIA